MKKARKYIALVALLFAAATAGAQVFIVTDEEFMDAKRATSNTLPIVPYHDTTLDQYAPIGNGLAVLTILGVAYLVGKRRKDSD